VALHAKPTGCLYIVGMEYGLEQWSIYIDNFIALRHIMLIDQRLYSYSYYVSDTQPAGIQLEAMTCNYYIW